MEHSTPELLLYVREQLAAGFTRSALESTLATAGWSAQAIEEVFRLLVEQHKRAPVAAPAMTVSNQLDAMIAGQDASSMDQSTPMMNQTSSYASAVAPSVSMGSPVSTESPAQPSQPLAEPFIDTPAMQQVLVEQESGASDQAMLPRDNQMSAATNLDTMNTEPMMQTPADTGSAQPKHHRHWWQIVILSILIVMTLALLLLVLHALNVYDALSINTPVWADSILDWIQAIFK